MIDWERVAELRNEIGKDDFDEVVEIFLEEVEEVIELFSANVAHDQLKTNLHFLKGSALNLGFRNLSSLCQNGETAAAQNQFDQIDLAAVIASYERSKAEFLAALSSENAA
jgi:HPt (histidine-containing phosphotransfer) domain-containing protein